MQFQREINKMIELPTEIWHQIFQTMDLKTKNQARLVCSQWRDILNYRKFWNNYIPLIIEGPGQRPIQKYLNWENTLTMRRYKKGYTPKIFRGISNEIQLEEGLFEEISEGRFRDCKQIKYMGYIINLIQRQLAARQKQIL